MNIPIPTDYLDGFQKRKLAKTNLEIFMEKTRKPKHQEINVPDSDKPPTNLGNGLFPNHVEKVHAKMTDYIQRRMFEKGLDVTMWKVGYEHEHKGDHVESQLKIAKRGEITQEEKEIMDGLMKELDSVPQEIFRKILGLE